MRERHQCFSITAADALRAYHEWGSNCGPGAIAAVLGMTLDQVRPHMGDFEGKRYTNPTLMFAVLDSIGRPWRRIGANWPKYGLARIQWEGPWMAPGVPMMARYRCTHWIGVAHEEGGERGIFDINATANDSGWISFSDWDRLIVPWILSEMVPRASGGWHLTHGIEVDRKGPPA